MTNKALGLIETYGYVLALEAADVCLKAADVKIIGLELVGGGFVTLKICGEVSSVKVSVDIGAAAVNRMGRVVSVDVISKTAIGLEKIIYSNEKRERSNKNDLEKIVEKKGINFEDIIISSENCNKLNKFKVVELRKIARQIDDFQMDKKKIKFAKKIELIKAIKNYLKGQEG
ncbi:BMC domain-containing protein [Maledivibacter halophilus]|uniref:Carboxysome shell and ethanolamine utilization microcompartment protein CcmL/EutN n=1 Tax=Maledivibacter halophilus TaxID=36842 RepID=A0A1T5M0G1_9FIRM|nr:BMC domain-containing protein [Maledivibacter halophilus]SKC81534.1 Carboxysome shell and ethanolamine utilization microcompartment protein CcmL/EutN [Maledivibacter halophilus]